jgi:hypothetical protein
MRRKTIGFAVAGGLLVVLGASAPMMADAATSPSPAVGPLRPASTVFDPVLAAFGVKDQASFDAVTRHQRNVATADDQTARAAAASGRSAPDVSSSARKAFFDAIDDLYATAAADPQAATARAQWQSCMVNGGFSYNSPSAVESDLSAVAAKNKATEQHLISVRDRCNDEDALLMSPIVQRAFGQWKTTHAGVIKAYRSEFGLPAD